MSMKILITGSAGMMGSHLYELLSKNNTNVVPTNTSYWNIMAQAGAQGGTVSSMADTNISTPVTDGALLAYQSSSNKWRDSNVFGGTFSAPVMDGGTF